jgi:hypothetical protein
MTTLTDEQIEEVAAMTNNDPKRLRQQVRRLCARCDEPLAGKRTALCEFAPYFGMRLDVECIAELVGATIEDEGAPQADAAPLCPRSIPAATAGERLPCARPAGHAGWCRAAGGANFQSPNR